MTTLDRAIPRSLTIFSALCALNACRADDANTASIKSLDNLTRGDRALVQNKCGVYLTPNSLTKMVPADKQKLSHIYAHSDAAAYEAAGTFMAVPKPLQSMFFAAGGVIRVVKDANKYCKSKIKSPDQLAFASESTDSVDACWDVWDGKLEVIVRDNEAAVHHALVRSFGYIYTQFYAARAPILAERKDVEDIVNKGMARFKGQRQKLGEALLKDLQDDPKAVRARFTLLAKTNSLDFGNFVIADSIDSYYCSPETRAVFKSEFPATWKVFTEGALAMTIDLGEPFAK